MEPMKKENYVRKFSEVVDTRDLATSVLMGSTTTFAIMPPSAFFDVSKTSLFLSLAFDKVLIFNPQH